MTISSLFSNSPFIKKRFSTRQSVNWPFGSMVLTLAISTNLACGGGAAATSPSPTPSVKPPTIKTPPSSQTVAPGQTATFSADVAGSAPLTYQWQRNNAVISGATAANYTTPPVTMAD